MCTFELYSDGRSVTIKVSDEMNIDCSYLCGARGSLDGAYLLKAKSPKQPMEPTR